MSDEHSTTPYHGINRDYWQLLLTIDCEFKQPDYLMMTGRRRTTEEFWEPFIIPAEAFQNFLTTIGNAAVFADGYRFSGSLITLPCFPNIDTVAICSGPLYSIELNESLAGTLQPTVSMTLFDCQSPKRPVLHLIDGEITSFLCDLREIDQNIGQLGYDNFDADETNPHLSHYTGSNYGCSR